MLDRRETFKEAHIMPRAYYGGNRFTKSDSEFIQTLLNTLSHDNRLKACQLYEEIYRKHFSKREFREARLNANSFLQDAAKECGITREEFRGAQVKTLGKSRHKFTEAIERIKALKPKVSILGFADEQTKEVRRKAAR